MPSAPTLPTPQQVLELVTRFEQQLDAYKRGQYNETQLRREFLDPFFKLLGWDIDNTSGYAEAYKDVVHEDAIRIGDRAKAPDYCFRIGGTRKFFLEAKKPSVFIKEEIPPAYQLRSYAWSAKLPLSILSDFEEFAIYDCRIKPRADDPASTARIFYCTFREYAGKWNEIAAIFSREAILKGSFDRFAESTKTKRGTAEFDQDFLATIEGWRKELAQNLALRNPKLTQRDLNFAIQRIIDRIIFLRICEARGIEDYGRLHALINGDRIYPRLAELFEAADARYNSGLFHFKKEAGRNEAPDEFTLDLQVDDKLLRDVLRGLYYPESPYRFSVIPADILGQVYEQFLGKVIRLTEGHRAVIEDKPEVKKAGGVYYTPTYIVDYIVRQTVGKLLDGIHSVGRPSAPPANELALPPHPDPLPQGEETAAAPPRKSDAPDSDPALDAILPLPRGEGRGEGEQPALSSRAANNILNRVAKLRILDPACGSGSFLIGAYQFLLDWHLQFYLANDPVKWAKGGKPALVQTTGGWKLTIAERKRILLNNIYGVDIDAQAVEVTKLSLLLKVLEGETQQTIEPLFRIFHERALPDLGNNIKCGNSLIGPDFYQQSELPLLTDEERYRINVFDWSGKDGFPEIMRAGGFDAVIGNPPYGAYFYEQDKTYLATCYPLQTYQLDSYLLFLERALKVLIRRGGYYGMIIPNPWLTNVLQTSVRRFVMANARVCSIVHFKFPVFPKVVVDTEVVVFQKEQTKGWRAKVAVVETLEGFISRPWRFGVREIEHSQQKWCDLNGGVINIFITECEEMLAAKCLRAGVKLDSLCEINVGIKPYQVGKGTPRQTRRIVEERPFDSDRRIDLSYRPCLRGSDIGRFKITPVERRFLRYGPWLAEPRPAADFDALVKIFMRQTGDSLVAALDNKQHLCLNNMHVLVPSQNTVSPPYLLGVINSKLLNWYYHTLNPEVGEALAEVKRTNVARLPIRIINPSNKADKAAHARMVSLVESMLDLHQKLAAARTPHEKTALERQIAATDSQIDRLVYDLYGLTEDEIKIVEGHPPDTRALLEQSIATEAAKPRRARRKSSYAQPPSAPVDSSLTPEKAYADAAHHYGKEDPLPYRTNSEPETGGPI